MKKLFSILLLCFTLNSFCQPGTTVPKTQNVSTQKTSTKTYPKSNSSEIILTVFPATVPCNHDQNIQCLQVQNPKNGNLETVEDIENFNYDLGYTYTILVKQTLKTPPIKLNESIYKYVWIKTLSKKEMEDESTSSTYQTTTNGKIIGQSNIQSSSPLDGKWYLRKLKETEGSSFVTDDNIMWIDINTFKDRIDGFGACNSFACVLKSDLKTTIEVSKLTTNYSYCGNKKIEDLFYELLQQADRFEIRDGNLFLSKHWNNLLIFTSNPNNTEDIIEKYTKPTIVEKENTTYATNTTLNNSSDVADNFSSETQTPNQTVYNAEIEAKNKEIEALKKQLAQQQNTSTSSNPVKTDTPPVKTAEELEQERLDKEAAALKQQLAEKKAKEDAAKALALKQQQEAEAKKQAELDKLKSEKQKEIEALKKQLAEMEGNPKSSSSVTTTTKSSTTSSIIKTSPSTITTTSTLSNTNNNNSDEQDDENKEPVKNGYNIREFTANNSNNIPDPEFPLRPYYLDGQSLVKLERAEANFAAKQKGLYRGIDMQVQVMKEESPIQFLKNKLPRFFITINDDDVDPFDIIDLCKADRIGKGRRNFTYAGKKYGGRVKDVTGKLISLDFKKIRKGLYEIIIDQELPQGEYAFLPLFKQESLSSTNSIKANCFGVVDPDK